MHIRDRIKELRRVRAELLRPNPANWRTHPETQRSTLKDLLTEIGYADALLARELPDGTLELVDGHLRAETTPDVEVPVLVLDIDEAEARKLLATLDPLCGMAGTNHQAFSELRQNIETESSAVRALVDDVLRRKLEASAVVPAGGPEMNIPPCFQVVVECEDEDGQREVYERLTAEGYKCRLLLM